MTLETVASFLDNIFWLLFLAGTTLATYVGARLAHIEGRSLWRAFFAALTSSFATLVVASMSMETLVRNWLYWIGVYTVIAALVIKLVLRASVKEALVPWSFSVLFFAAVFLMRHFLLSAP